MTLAWECERHHPDYDSPGLPADQLATMARHTPGLPGPAVRTIAHASLLRHTDAAREHVAAIADDRTTDALTVVSAAADAYRDVEHHARRLSGTTTAVSRASAALNPTPPHPGPDNHTGPPHHHHDHPPTNHPSETTAAAGEVEARRHSGQSPVLAGGRHAQVGTHPGIAEDSLGSLAKARHVLLHSQQERLWDGTQSRAIVLRCLSEECLAVQRPRAFTRRSG